MSTTSGHDVIVTITENDRGTLLMTAHFQGEKFSPGTVKSHAALQALHEAWPDIVNRVFGRFTDADRYQALKEFSLLASTDKPRFTVINDMLQKFEEENGMADEHEKTEHQVVATADFLIHATAQTKTKLEAPTAQPEA